MFWIEAAGVLAALVLAALVRGRHLRRAERALRHLAARKGLAVGVVGGVALAARLALVPLEGLPEPQLHDEFSHLLAADTFASGRLANPTHPLWIHFETFHVGHQPTYMSMYPPAQGLALAAGIRLGGHPWVGVWLSCALLCAALCWMLQGWLPPCWALLGGLLAVIRLGLFSYWTDSYWGGALPALGGALVLGALPRVLKRPAIPTALGLAFGLLLLANSRPYEGFVLALASAAVWLALALRQRSDWRAVARRLLLPAGAALALGLAAMLYYNQAVFGDPLTFPYEINRGAYAPAPYFIWQAPRAIPAYHHEVMRSFYVDWELAYFESVRSGSGYAGFWLDKLSHTWIFYVGPLLTPALLMFPFFFWDRRVRPLLLIGGLLALGSLPQAWFLPHYAAPFTAGLYALLMQGMRHLRAWRLRGRPSGVFLVQALVALALGMALLRTFAAPLGLSVVGSPLSWYSRHPQLVARTQVVEALARRPGRHLVVVRYAADHDPHREYVYNEADIEGADIVWAREVDPERNRQLLAHFSQRRAWLLEPDAEPMRLLPYPMAGEALSD